MSQTSRIIAGYQHHLRECEQIAGKALGYPWFKDDPKNFPGATEEDGVCVGEHIGDSIVEELARRYTEATAEIERLRAKLDEIDAARVSLFNKFTAAELRALAAEAQLLQARKALETVRGIVLTASGMNVALFPDDVLRALSLTGGEAL